MPPPDLQSDQPQVSNGTPGGESAEKDATLDRATLNAAYASMLARDQIVLVLAASGIAGVIAAMLGIAVAERSVSMGWFLLTVVAAVYFLSSILSSLKLFQSSADYLMKLARNEPGGNDSEQLGILRNEASDALALGIICALAMAIIAVWSR